jgi:hypothetical protein
MSMWDDVFGGGSSSNPANAAMPYLEQVPSTVSPYYNPYINLGKAQTPGLEHQYHAAMRNPGGVENRIGAGYQESPGYQFSMQQALDASNNTAASGGMAGSPQHEQQNATLASNLANQDYYRYLENAMKLYSGGLQGSQGLFNTGYGASDALAKELSRNLYSEAGAQYSGQASQNMGKSSLFGGLAGDAAGLGMAYMLM